MASGVNSFNLNTSPPLDCKTNVIFIQHTVDDQLANAISVVLEDQLGEFGIKRKFDGEIVVDPGTVVENVSTGRYEYDISNLDAEFEYVYVFKIIDGFDGYGATVEYVEGVIPRRFPVSGSEGIFSPGSTIFVEHTENDQLAEAQTVTLESPCGTFGIKRRCDDLEDVVVCADTPVAMTSIGRYEYDISSLDLSFDYEFVFKIVDQNDNVQFVEGVIPKVGAKQQFTTGTGTFQGGDGTFDLPATGGERTNRDGYGDGFWDGISYEDLCVIPITPRGQCFKDKTAAMTRAMLKDTDPSCWAFTEDEVDMYLEGSLSDFNSTPMFTSFTWDSLEDRWLHIIALGGVVFALYAQGLIEAGREFSITDNGISFTPPQISGYMQTTASQLLAHYTEKKNLTKGNFKPRPSGVGTFRVLAIHPHLFRLRHLREKRII